MPRSPLRLYESLLACVDGASERERVAAVRRALRQQRLPDRLGGVLERAGVGTGYVLRHVLSIQRFAPDVRDALEAGLPLAVARLVNGLTDAATRARVLEPLTTTGDASRRALLPANLARDIELAARAAISSEPLRLTGAGATGAGWMLADADRAPKRALRGNAWTFPAPTVRRRVAEPLHPIVIEGLLERILRRGGRLVDVTAGSGSFALVGRRHAVETWSGDLHPGAPFVRRADARTLLADAHPGLARGAADALVVHPPTYPTWAKQVDAREPSDLEAYADAVGEMVAGSLAVVRPGGSVVLVTRPVRSKEGVWLTTSHLAQLLQDQELPLRGYVVAVADDGSEDWHVLIAGVPIVER
ncbi:DNA methyltransferase [soil metagenome]